jgi:hypothetical protein
LILKLAETGMGWMTEAEGESSIELYRLPFDREPKPLDALGNKSQKRTSDDP